jgi:trk system potassium uptake protein TrkA
MQIIIVGCGKVGYTLARHLAAEENDVVVIDKKGPVLEKAQESIDVMTIPGNGLSWKTLAEASVKTADLIISVTSSDEANILCCLTAKRLGAKHAIARVRDPEYALELYRFRKDLGLDLIINPEQTAALEISRLLRFPSVNEIETFVNGRVEMVSMVIDEGNEMLNKPLSEMFAKRRSDILITTIERGQEVIIPHGGTLFRSGDVVRVLGRPAAVSDFVRFIGLSMPKIKDVMIIGGGKITHYLADILEKMDVHIKVIEIDEEKCRQLNEALPDSLIICGDGTDEEVLRSESVQDAEAVVCLTDRDEENVVIALYAMHCGVPKVIVKINRINVDLVKNLDIGSVLCPKNITAYQIIRYVRGMKNSFRSGEIQTMYKIVDRGKHTVEALEFNVNSGSRCLDIPLMKLGLKKSTLVACIMHGGNIIIPTGSSVIHEGDTVIVVTCEDSINELDDILDG